MPSLTDSKPDVTVPETTSDSNEDLGIQVKGTEICVWQGVAAVTQLLGLLT